MYFVSCKFELREPQTFQHIFFGKNCIKERKNIESWKNEMYVLKTHASIISNAHTNSLAICQLFHTLIIKKKTVKIVQANFPCNFWQLWITYMTGGTMIEVAIKIASEPQTQLSRKTSEIEVWNRPVLTNWPRPESHQTSSPITNWVSAFQPMSIKDHTRVSLW